MCLAAGDRTRFTDDADGTEALSTRDADTGRALDSTIN